MSLAFLIYLVSLLHPLNFLVGFAMIACAAAAFFTCGSVLFDGEGVSNHKLIKKLAKWSSFLMVVFALLFVAIPKEKTAWLMVGGYAAQTVYESEAGDKLKKIVSNKLDSILQEQLDGAKEKK